MTKNNSKHVKPKERAIRYYGYDKIAYKLYEDSKNDQTFYNLIDLIQDDNNIAQAYRSIKANKGAKTKGSDKKNITNLANIKLENLRKTIIRDCNHYHPNSIRRVMIPKKKPGEFRPLGIPTTYDKLIQQMIKQIIEPIFEAKFVTTSYGFRPSRSQHQAIEHIHKLIAQGEYTHAIEFDIKKCFDNISHEILMEILYREGIRDDKILMMIKAMLKAEIVGEGRPDKGTPQGGVLSPLLANLYLNELDKFIYEKFQWLPLKMRKYQKLYKLRPVHIVRYADDFCIFTKSRKDALHYMDLTIKFLKEQLKLDYSPNKTRITNLKRRAITFLGIRIKACKSGIKKVKHLVAKSSIPKESIDKLIKKTSNESDPKLRNIVIRGAFNYWRIATNVTEAVNRFNYFWKRATKIKPTKKKTLRDIDSKGLSISPEGYINSCNYIKSLTACQDSFIKNIEKLTDLNISTWYKRDYDTIEKYDIIRSKYRSQHYKDTITNEPLLRPHCHRIKPGYKEGTYNYQNCILVNDWTHRIIHGTQENLIKFCKTYKLKKKQIEKLAKLYKEAH